MPGRRCGGGRVTALVFEGKKEREKEEVEITFGWGSWMWRPA